MTRAEALALVVAPMASGMARLVIRETLKAWPDEDVAAWHRMKDTERKKAKRVRSDDEQQTGQIPVGNRDGDRTESGRQENSQPDTSSPPLPPPSSPHTPLTSSPYIPLTSVPAPAVAGRRKKAKSGQGEDSAPADPRFSAVVAGYSVEWAHAFPSQVGGYRFEGGRDGKALKDFLAGVKVEVTADQIVGVIRRALERSKEQFATACKRASSLHGFCAAWNDIRREITAHGTNGSANGRAPAETDLHTRKGRFGI